MKPFLFCLLLILTQTARATRPFPPRIFAQDDFTFIVGFPWPDQDENVLYMRTRRHSAQFSMADLGVNLLDEFSTAGSLWYQNAIGYVLRHQIPARENEPARHQSLFVFRHRSGTETAIDLLELNIVEAAELPDREILREHGIRAAAQLLASNSARDRETAALHLGQLRSRKHIPQLNRLLEDPATSSVSSDGGPFRTVYFVREAAKTALHQIEETP
ncbi:MAG: hypothetical protein JJU05_19040 [Verrucomicrobia bacterium]|nr:hypothetical protein [Verrucomicrobiota bacterium]